MARGNKGARPIDAFAIGSFRVVSIDAATLVQLSVAERSVVGLAVLGMSNKAIATQRRSSPRTVANQLANAYRKLGVGSRAELIVRLQQETPPRSEP